jgi:pyridoxamine 5'-phosphate oxidase
LPADDPLRLFADWYELAARDESSPELTAVATASAEGRPSVRMVELQRFDVRGFVFYTGTESRKGRELAANPFAALVFYWHASRHQVRVEGRVEPAPLDADEAETAARASADARQGEPVADRDELEARVAEARARYGDPPPLPSDWGAFRLVPDAYEFWEYRDDKLHDRFRYRLAADGSWEVERLFP